MNSNKLIAAFQLFLEEQCGASKQNKFLLAVSGGLDSVVLTQLFFQCQYTFAIAHCNFNLRGEESNADEKFVNELANKYDVKVFSQHFDTLKVAEQENISIQMAARNLRYKWFEKLRTENNFDFIATAHHQEDSTETVLLNIIRGKGLEGLKGIPVKNNFVIRPVLFATRKEILEYASENNLKWREDSSNATTDYHRNFIRHKIIPLLKEINPSVHDAIKNISQFTSESLLLLEETIKRYSDEIILHSGDDVIIDAEKINNHPAKKTLIYYLLKDFNFNSSQIDSLCSEKPDNSGIVFYSVSHRLIVNRKQFIITSPPFINDDPTYLINKNDHKIYFNDTILEINLTDDFNLSDCSKTNAVIDASKIKFPLVLRRWQKGDYFYPLGMEHRKKLSDYFTDEKFSLADKERTWLIVNPAPSGDEIVWVVNHRLDNRYRVTDETKKVIQLQIKKSVKENG